MRTKEDVAALRAAAAVLEVRGGQFPSLKSLAIKVSAIADEISKELETCETSSSDSG